jgi:hypothetical protein
VSLLTLPIDLVTRGLDDLGAIARVARELPERLDALEARAEKVQEQLDRAVVIGETIADNSAAMVELGERMIILGDTMVERSTLIADRAREVADRGGEVAAALPMLERAVAMASPLEGTVERLGRALDRLPGGRASDSIPRNVTSADET